MDVGSWFDSSLSAVRVPLFEDVLKFCIDENIWMNIEIKPVPGVEEETGACVAGLTAKYFPTSDSPNIPLFSSFSFESLQAAQLIAPHIPRGYLISCIDDISDWKQRMETLQAVSVHVNHKRLERSHIEAIKTAGYGLFCYTVNDVDRSEELLSQSVDAFCTDRVDLFKK